MKYRVIYIGSGSIGKNVLQTLINDPEIEISSVITGLDKKSGRNLVIHDNLIKKTALMNNLIVHQANHIGDIYEKIGQEVPDYLMVFSFGEIIPEGFLNLPKIAPINIHASILPKYRGSSPIQQSILDGQTESGITWIIMNKKIDQGRIIDFKSIRIDPEDNKQTLSDKLGDLAARFTPEIIKKFASDRSSHEQPDNGASYTKKITRNDGFLNFKIETAQQILRKLRAYYPWPGCYIFLSGQRIKINEAIPSEQKIDTNLCFVNSDYSLHIGTLQGSIKLTHIQKEGKPKCSIKDFVNGLRLKPGATFNVE